jgi:NAD(P)H-hydrate epimerase
MKQLDDRTIIIKGMPSMVLMERAALASVAVLHEEGFDLTRTICVCGPGNNGGDGFAVARLLHLAGYEVSVLFVGDPAKRSAETRQQQKIAANYGVKIRDVAASESPCFSRDGSDNRNNSDDDNNRSNGDGCETGEGGLPPTTVVDAMFGIGGSRALSGIFLEAVRFINVCKESTINDAGCAVAKILALDIPSGISADTGEVLGECVNADVTVTFAYPKLGLTRPPGSAFAGKVIVKDVGIYQ